MSFSLSTIGIASLGGIIPALFWLWFWLHEDSKRPEPRGRIVITFIAGMIAVFAVLPLERAAQDISGASILLMLILWSVIEEVIKYVFAYFAGLHNKAMDEPVDALIYMITAALGFAAMENTLFLLTPIEEGLIVQSLLTGNLRFIGASILHTLASGVIGACIGFSFYKTRKIRHRFVALGLILAILLHTLFNFSIMTNETGSVLGVFVYVWIGAVVLLMLFERVKRIRKTRSF